ncbi:N-acyl-aromatic-L-amino acid amidohydrolase (carboxylate-forming) [Ornithorhynchus anatinus]|uniref:N-acyl-aromatic-L-amino acid amidohydrolase (carboxylate-forming) n=1 Tax=Ornithorhynchus anatinus TaxID=9258 RepID=UPI0019D4BEB4|nr:N-acyl-aromatic-L-amino acid amidohydrolase (carboxylate-forming) [Ornithorhynchus anatinus]
MCSQASTRPMRRVAVCGGTHGNELSGVTLARLWLRDPAELRRQTFAATALLANPRATRHARRYLDQDLNRSFTAEVLASPPAEDDPYEVTRAREINRLFGPKGSAEAFDFLLDMHNTTANMGSCLIANSAHNTFVMHLCRHIQVSRDEPACPIYLFLLPGEQDYALTSVGKNGLGLELGPQPHGVVRADLLFRMRALVSCVLDFIDLFNQGTEFPAADIEVYQSLDRVDYPRGPEGFLEAAVHPTLQDRDFLPLRPGAPVFQTFGGEEIVYEGAGTVYPAFINEAAYYEKGIAFSMTEKRTISLPALRVSGD